jgi:serine phosphatase RsbU (regulator of sigma subunit)
MFHIFQNKNSKFIIVSTNDKLITLTLLLGYMIVFIFYNQSTLLFMFLFMQLYLLKDFKYNIIFLITFVIFYFFKHNTINIESFSYIATSYIPLSICLVLDFIQIKSYFYLFYALLVTFFNFNSKPITVESNYIDNLFKDFKKYIDGLNLEYNHLCSIKKIKDSHIESIITNYCNCCKKNTLCKYKTDKRMSFIIGAMFKQNSNIYDCPHYENFYFNDNLNIKPSLEYSAISELANELELLYNQSLKLAKHYNKFISDLSFYGYKIKNIDINLANQTIYFSMVLDSKKPVIKEIFIKLAYKSFGEELDLKIVSKDNQSVIYMYKKPKIKLDYSHIILPKDNNIISGDNYYIKRDYNDSYIFALSDGMGSGHSAYIESADTLKLMANLSSYHFSIKTILKLLEDIYNLRCDYDNYATLDLAIINTSNMKMNLYKLGSTTTYIYHNFNLIAYENKTLPLKLDDINSTYEIEFYKDDIIFILSDGVTDFLSKDELFLVIDPSMSSNELMISITNKVKEKEKVLRDDLSLIVIKVI